MTANEKANDLVNQYRMILIDEDTDCGNEILCTLIAVKCSKVTVYEIIESIKRSGEYSSKVQINWWLKVIKHLDEI
jgi:hypothetical protein